MISPLSTGVRGDAGVSGIGLIINTQLGWEFRPQPVADVGIDAQIEPVADTVSTGRLLGVQIKAWPSLIENPTRTGKAGTSGSRLNGCGAIGCAIACP